MSQCTYDAQGELTCEEHYFREGFYDSTGEYVDEYDFEDDGDTYGDEEDAGYDENEYVDESNVEYFFDPYTGLMRSTYQ